MRNIFSKSNVTVAMSREVTGPIALGVSSRLSSAWIGKAFLPLLFVAFLADSPAVADSENHIRIGTLASKAAFVDNVTGVTYHILLEGDESSDSGKGSATFGIWGPSTHACTTHGAGIEFEFKQNPDGSFGYVGNNPLQALQCGTAYGQSVSIKGCIARIEAHGYTHSDHPNLNFMGTTTLEVRYDKSNGPDEIKVTLYTPKEQIKLSGKITEGNVVMGSCNK